MDEDEGRAVRAGQIVNEAPGRLHQGMRDAFWRPENLQRITEGSWQVPPDPQSWIAPEGISIDSRTTLPGEAFLAVPGQRFDGHDYAPEAMKRGARLLILQRQMTPAPSDVAVLVVPDTVRTLQNLASAYRHTLAEGGCRVVAITGSNGKTTTRRLIHTLLSAKLSGSQSPRSYNNHLGVPLTLLTARPEQRFVAVEIGTNHPGEIPALAAIARPDAAVITQLGLAHIENFGTPEAIAAEKCSLLSHVRSGGLAVLPGDLGLSLESGVERLTAALPADLPESLQVVVVGKAPRDLPLRSRSIRLRSDPVARPEGGMSLRVSGRSETTEMILPLWGQHNVVNALAAVAVARWFGLEEDEIARAMTQVAPAEMRLAVERIGGQEPDGSDTVLLINDAYNANPHSVEAALRTLAVTPTPSADGRRIAVIGDMLELGSHGPAEHRRIGQVLARMGGADGPIHRAVLIGHLAMFFAEALARRWPHPLFWAEPTWTEDLPHRLAQIIEPGDTVLIKGSRGMALERLLPALYERFAPEG